MYPLEIIYLNAFLAAEVTFCVGVRAIIPIPAITATTLLTASPVFYPHTDCELGHYSANHALGIACVCFIGSAGILPGCALQSYLVF